VDYVDLVNTDEEEGKLSVIFTKEYMCKEMQESDDFELIQDSIEDIDYNKEESKFSEDDINDLI
jgi:hypothetical protein